MNFFIKLNTKLAKLYENKIFKILRRLIIILLLLVLHFICFDFLYTQIFFVATYSIQGLFTIKMVLQETIFLMLLNIPYAFFVVYTIKYFYKLLISLIKKIKRSKNEF